MGAAKKWGYGILFASMLIAGYFAVTSYGALTAPLTAEQVATIRDLDRANYRLLDACYSEWETEGIYAGTRSFNPDCSPDIYNMQQDCQTYLPEVMEYLTSCRDERVVNFRYR